MTDTTSGDDNADSGAGPDETVVAQAGPFQVDVVEGKRYFWCTCGRSSKQPFCDGSHVGTSFQSKAFVAETTGVVNLCGCKQTDDAPFCDGSHNLV
ncbi:MAG: CDGSH iron-sulfur domain-containing protein [Pseudomonadota bacterium]